MQLERMSEPLTILKVNLVIAGRVSGLPAYTCACDGLSFESIIKHYL